MTLRAFLLGYAAMIGCSFVTPIHAQIPAPLNVKSVEFTATQAPATVLEMTQPYTHSETVVTQADGSKKTFPLSYQVLHRSGDYIGGWYSGLIVGYFGDLPAMTPWPAGALPAAFHCALPGPPNG